MKKTVIILTAALSPLLSLLLSPNLVFADLTSEDCAVLDCTQGIDGVLELVVDIMTIGIGILGVIGITVVGIQYLTAGGSEEKTRKAKRRLFEIVIGLVAYVIIYTFLRWLLPNFGA